MYALVDSCSYSYIGSGRDCCCVDLPKTKKAARIILTVICVFIMILSVIYIGLTALFLDAARNKPPVEVLLLTDMGTPL